MDLMPRRSTGEKLEKVVSTKIVVSDFELLEKYARLEYNKHHITHTISVLLGSIISRWRNDVMHKRAQIELETGEEYDYEKGGVKKKKFA
jgi:hypothetical protein